jgi:hypothetical protein
VPSWQSRCRAGEVRIGRAATPNNNPRPASSGEAQRTWRTKLADAGLNVTPVLDRQYFHSIYFWQPARGEIEEALPKVRLPKYAR